MTREEKAESEMWLQRLLEADLDKKENWDKLWYFCDWICSNMAKSMLKGIKMPTERFTVRYQEALFEVMTKIKGGLRPKSSAYFYWPVRRALQGPAAIQEDREMVSYDYFANNKEEE